MQDFAPLQAYGWSDHWKKAFDRLAPPSCFPARILTEHWGGFKVIGPDGESSAELRGRLIRSPETPKGRPAVGDWVGVEGNATPGVPQRVRALLPRRSQFVRQAAGNRTREQVVAANIDIVFLVMALNVDFNLRRLERYLVAARESGAQPIVLLTKSDLCEDVDHHLELVVQVARELPVHALSSLDRTGLEALDGYFTLGTTSAFLGSSGVGKSTLINRLAGSAVMETADVDESGRGRHTTRRRQLIRLPRGGLVLDTPGMRELQIWDGEEGLSETFDDVEALAGQCRFSDCSHGSEPGCAVQEAIRSRHLQPQRFRAYLKLQDEVQRQARRRSEAGQLAEKKQLRKLHKGFRDTPKKRR